MKGILITAVITGIIGAIVFLYLADQVNTSAESLE